MIGLLGCAAADTAVTKVQAVAQAQASPTLSVADATFLDQAARTGIEIVTFAQLARTQGARVSSRDFGTRMEEAQTGVNQRVTRVAGLKQVTPITGMDTLHQQRYDRLQALPGRAFDRAFLDQQATDFQALAMACRDEAAGGRDADVKALAAGIAPEVAHHLDSAVALGGVPGRSP